MVGLLVSCLLPAMFPFGTDSAVATDETSHALSGHPRLYFTAADLPRLRGLRDTGLHRRIWENLAASADWCLTRPVRTKWIAPVTPDPIYANLYDRFYGMMHDMAVMEHLAFAYAYSGDERYFEGARRWTLSACRVWGHEADGETDVSKAYAVTRILKGIAVAYDLLFEGLSGSERDEIRDALMEIGGKYYLYFQDPAIAGPGHNTHHGSVEAGAFGVLALALIGDVPEAKDWLDLMIAKHVDYLLPHGLTAGGTQEQSSNYWASTMQYRIFFMDALKRVTGRDLFAEFPDRMPGQIALAAVAGPGSRDINEDQQSILFGPSYGQLDYWSPVLVYLARETRKPIYQHLALWDPRLGAIQKTRYITEAGEQLLFHMGGYVYTWADPTVPDRIEPGLERSFKFPEVHEAYMRSSYEVGALVVGMRLGQLVVHAGGGPVLIDLYNIHHEPEPGRDLDLTDDGNVAIIRSVGPEGSVVTKQSVTLHRPDRLTIRRETDSAIGWWCHGTPTKKDNTLTWSNGTELIVMRGTIETVDPKGYHDRKNVGMGKLDLADPTPMYYPRITAQPTDGVLEIEIRNQ
jgi:hypothetical protein